MKTKILQKILIPQNFISAHAWSWWSRWSNFMFLSSVLKYNNNLHCHTSCLSWCYCSLHDMHKLACHVYSHGIFFSLTQLSHSIPEQIIVWGPEYHDLQMQVARKMMWTHGIMNEKWKSVKEGLPRGSVLTSFHPYPSTSSFNWHVFILSGRWGAYQPLQTPRRVHVLIWKKPWANLQQKILREVKKF